MSSSNFWFSVLCSTKFSDKFCYLNLFLNLLASVISKLFIFLFSLFTALSLISILSSDQFKACIERLWKNSLIAFSKIFFLLPRWTFNAAKNYTKTNPWASVELKFSYKSNGERILLAFMDGGTTPAGTTTRLLMPGNLPI